MKHFYSLLILIVTLVILPLTAQAAGPEEMLRGVVESLKTSGDPKVLLKNVHWQTAFDNLSDYQRQTMKVGSPQALENYYVRLFDDPAGAIKAQLEDYTVGMNDEAKKLNAEQINRVASLMKTQIEEGKQKLKSVQYEIGQADIKDNRAIIKLTSIHAGKTAETYVKMIRIGDRWYFPSLDIVASTSGVKQ
ncbi:MAG: hypothetical protein IT292_01245 [Deltaproteobacteria bacterium]|nr:hypothetical protein [Deltaproteobacteria bacterium]